MLGFWVIASLTGIGFSLAAYVREQQNRWEEYNRYQIALTSYSEEEVNRFLTDFPDSKYREMLDLRKKQIHNILQEWKRLQHSDRVQDFLDFAHRFPQSPLAFECDLRIDSLEWLNALAEGSLDGYICYLSKHPNGKYIKQALAEKQKIERTTLNDSELQQVNQIMTQLKDAIDQGNSHVYDSLKQQGVTVSDTVLMNYMLDCYQSVTNIGQTSVKKKYNDESVYYEASISFKYAEHKSDTVESINIALRTTLNNQFEIKNIQLTR